MADVTWFLPLVAGGALTLGAAAIGDARGRRDEHGRWLRDRRLDAYTELNDSIADLALVVRRASGDSIQEALVDDAHQRFGHAAQRVRLIGTPPLQELVDEAGKRVRVLADALRVHWPTPGGTPADLEAAVNALDTTLTRLTARAHAELTKPAPTVARRLRGTALGTSD